MLSTVLRTHCFSFLPGSYHCHVQVHPLLFKITMIFFPEYRSDLFSETVIPWEQTIALFFFRFVPQGSFLNDGRCLHAGLLALGTFSLWGSLPSPCPSKLVCIFYRTFWQTTSSPFHRRKLRLYYILCSSGCSVALPFSYFFITGMIPHPLCLRSFIRRFGEIVLL